MLKAALSIFAAKSIWFNNASRSSSIRFKFACSAGVSSDTCLPAGTNLLTGLATSRPASLVTADSLGLWVAPFELKKQLLINKVAIKQRLEIFINKL